MKPERLLELLAYVYLLRFPLLILLIFVGLPALALWTNARAVLGGIFDIDTGGRMFWVTLAAFTTAWTIMDTGWLVLGYSHSRFDAPPLPWPLLSEVTGALIFGAVALWIVFAALWESARESKALLARLLPGALGGLFASAGLLWLSARNGVRFEDWAWVKWTLRWLARHPNIGAGYVGGGPESPLLLEGHVRALLLAILLLVFYSAIGLGFSPWRSHSRKVPTLAYVCLLLMLLCWGFAGLAFFFDRYRFPALLPIFLLFVFTSFSARSDHYYHVSKTNQGNAPSPAAVIRAGERTSVIVVAANGGGIQAAAWAARVLTGLEIECRREMKRNPNLRDFGDSVRLISSVSGGSVGAMFFVDAYGPTGLPNNDDLEEVVERAKSSSLDEVAWGLAYPDFWRPIFPCLVPKERDRAAALENAWGGKDDNLRNPLGAWREGVEKGWRPAVIFNATIADSGERLLLATSDVSPARYGRKNFDELYPGCDLPVTTAARLSATFPYVTPAARADLPGPQFHVVDGGYYDNYGVSTLVEWLDQALNLPDNTIVRVLIVEIRGGPPGQYRVRNNQRGWLYQCFAPVATMLHVRNSGQISHNEVELNLVGRVPFPNPVKIEPVVFEFQEPRLSRSTRAGPPLSWHLTEEQKKDIELAWREELCSRPNWAKVKAFLSA